jgi:hypothetical protein
MNIDPNKIWEELGKLVITAEADELKTKKCPYCGNELHFTYVAGERPAIKIECKKCINRMWLDGVSSMPPWALKTGNTIHS